MAHAPHSTPLSANSTGVSAQANINVNAGSNGIHRDQPDQPGQPRVFIGNLAFAATEIDVTSTLRTLHGVPHDAQVTVLRTRSGRSLGSAVVAVHHDEQVKNIVDALNGMVLNGRTVTARVYTEKAPTTRKERAAGKKKIHDQDAHEAEAAEASTSTSTGTGTEAAGTEAATNNPRGRKNRGRRSRRNYKKHNESTENTNTTNQQQQQPPLEKKEKTHNPPKERVERDPERSLFVQNIPWRTSWQDLKDLFAEYGAVKRADVVMNRATRRSKGFGFVTFETKEAAEAAQKALDGVEFEGRQLVVKAHDPSTSRKKQQQQQQQAEEEKEQA